MHSKRFSILAILFTTLFFSCNQSSNDSSEAYLADISVNEDLIPKAGNHNKIEATELSENLQIQSQKKIIKDGNMGIVVDDLQKAKAKVDSLLAIYNGYYANENLSNSNDESTFTLKIRIPSQNFEDFIANIESGGFEIQYKNIDARDVTEEFIDLETRLENKKSYLVKYNELLKQAKSINDILEIEEHIRNLEEEIESTEGRLKYLGNQVAFSTLNLNITQEKAFRFEPKKHHHFGEKLKQSFSNGWYAFIAFLLFIIKLWPFWILAGIGSWFWKRRRSKKKK